MWDSYLVPATEPQEPLVSNLNRELWFATLPILIFGAVRGQPCIWGHLGQVVNSCSTDPKDRQLILRKECPCKRSEEARLYCPPAQTSDSVKNRATPRTKAIKVA